MYSNSLLSLIKEFLKVILIIIFIDSQSRKFLNSKDFYAVTVVLLNSIKSILQKHFDQPIFNVIKMIYKLRIRK